jgi:hypothetical protein
MFMLTKSARIVLFINRLRSVAMKVACLLLATTSRSMLEPRFLGKLRVGDNVNIGANFVVLKDVPPNVTVLGVPAAVFRKLR